MPSTAKQVETTTYEAVQATPIMRVHGRPMQKQLQTLKSNASALTSEVEDITYAWSKSATDDYGLLGNILSVDKYYKITGISNYAIPMEPTLYDPSINNTMPTHKRKCKEEDWDLIHTVWFIRKGFLQWVINNLRDTLDKQYYSQLKNCLMAYRNVTPFQILEHLNNRWCPLDVKAKKALKDAYYTQWDGGEHLTAFGKRLNNNQCTLVRSDVTIVDKDKVQFNLEEMYDSNHFDKNEMLNWEQQATTIKTNYTLAKQYFKALVKATKTYKENRWGGMAGQNKYKSVNQLVDCGNEIYNYFAQIASAVAANNGHAANTQAKDTQFKAMLMQIKALTKAVAKLTANKVNISVNSNTNDGNKIKQLTKIRNMGDGRLLPLTWFSSSWHQPRQQILHLEDRQTQP
jgi:hypothetical protein